MYEIWQQLNGLTVTVDGLTWIIDYRAQAATYPYPHTAEYVYLDPTPETRRGRMYREEKARLGDDWSIDVREMEPEAYNTLLLQHIPEAEILAFYHEHE